jgi:hyperosmotically inducible periplasmic protein
MKIWRRVQSRFYQDEDIRGDDLEVRAESGVVTLIGKVRNERVRQHAVEVARRTEGVRDVRDELKVGPEAPRDPVTAEPGRPEAPADRPETGREPHETRGVGEHIEDGWITTKIQSRYFLDRDLKGRDIDVTTQNGVVTLSGTVQSEAARQQALAIARETDGVGQVVDRLTVKPQ